MVDNPFVGPQPFGTDQRTLFFGRDREARELADLLVAERVVLMHAPSGAGKTSLIQARLIPELRDEFDVLPVIRVGHPAPPGARNRYVHSALTSLGAPNPGTTLSAHLAAAQPGSRPQLLIFDQFEEVLTLDPYDLDAKEAFFAELIEVLRRDKKATGSARRWALFAMRDEFVAALSPYLKRLPCGFGETYRLDLLDAEAALDAVRRPVAARGVAFDEAAAVILVDNLRRVRGRAAGEQGPLGPHVEPVQLQVVCFRMWEKLRERTVGAPAADEPGRSAQGQAWEEALAAKQVALGPADVAALANVDEVLSEYFAERVRRAADRGKTSERTVRAWVEHCLITPAGFRSAVQIGSGLGFDPAPEVLKELDDAHLIRREERLGQVWVQLSHDRLLDPIRANNRRWMEQKLVPFQMQAMFWEGQGRPTRLLLTGTARTEAEAWASQYPERLDDTDREFLHASGAWIATTRWERVRRHFYRNGRGWLIAVVTLAILGFALDAYWQRRKAYTARDQADDARAEAEKQRDSAARAAAAAAKSADDARAAEKRAEELQGKLDDFLRRELAAVQRTPWNDRVSPQLTNQYGKLTELAARRRLRPIQPGISISGQKGTAGTLCAVVRGRADGRFYLLTVDHAINGPDTRPGDAVVQPGVSDAGDPIHDRVATVTRVLPVRFDRPNPTSGALAELDAKTPWKPEILALGHFQFGEPAVDQEVVMVGRSAALTRGRVTQVGVESPVTFLVGKDLRTARFQNLIVIQGTPGLLFSQPGDSGAPILNKDGELVGMLFASNMESSFALPIKPILDALQVDLVTDEPKKK